MKVLEERKKTHGSYHEVAETTLTGLKLFTHPDFDDVQKTSMIMIINKLARIKCGDPDFIDSWRDIAGYATLAVNHLQNKPGATDVKNVRITIEGDTNEG